VSARSRAHVGDQPLAILERFEVSCEEAFKRLLVARAGLAEQMKSWFDLSRTTGYRLEASAGILIPGHQFESTSYPVTQIERPPGRFPRFVRIAGPRCL
jgi:hypothetical protein